MPKKRIDTSSDEGDDDDDEWEGSDEEEEDEEEDEVVEVAKPQKQKAAAAKTAAAKRPAAKPGPSKPVADPKADAEAAKLQLAAVKADLVHTDREPSYEYSLLHPSKELRQVASKRSADVVRNKGATGKKKYLMMLPGRFAPVDGGTIGTIEKLDTPNPELLLHWPSKGKLQLSGSLLRPKARYLTMRHDKGKMVAEDVFDNVVVFSKAQWLQSSTEEAEGEDGAGADPSLVPGPMPGTVHRELHKKYSFAGGAAGEGTAAAGAGSARGGSIRAALESAAPPPGGGDSDADSDAGPAAEADGGDEPEVIDVDADEADGEAPSRPSRSAPRSSRARKKSYVDAGSSAEDDAGSESDDEEQPLGELRRVAPSSKPASKGGSSGAKKSNEDAKKPAAKATKPAAKPKPAAPASKPAAKPKAAPASKPAPKPKRARDDDGSDSSEGFVGDWMPRKAPDPPSRGRRKSGGSTYKEESNSDDSMS